jgi:hypothetical protein
MNRSKGMGGRFFENGANLQARARPNKPSGLVQTRQSARISAKKNRKRLMPRAPRTALAASLAVFPLTALAQPAVMDNARVTVRDIHLEKGVPGPAISHAGDHVVLYFDGGRIRAADGRTARHPAGDAAAGHGGTTADTSLDGPAREIVVELKDASSNTVPNTTGLPPGFPREGARLVLETPKVRVWNYTWLLNKPTPMHFHNTEIVVAYRGDGDIKATTPDGRSNITHRATGDIVYNLANRSHSEELIKGTASGVMLELK